MFEYEYILKVYKKKAGNKIPQNSGENKKSEWTRME